MSNVARCVVGSLLVVLSACGPAEEPEEARLLESDRQEVNIGSAIVYPLFARPSKLKDPSGDDYSLLDFIVGTINQTQPGATIHMAAHKLGYPAICNALLGAVRDRGVTVAIIADGGIVPKDEACLALVNELKARWAYDTCGNHGSDSCNGDGIMHSKFITFSHIYNGGHWNNVSIVTTANFERSTGSDAYNDGLIIYGDPTLFNALDDVFWKMWNWRVNDYGSPPDFFDSASGRGYSNGPVAQLRASPQMQSDHWLDLLNEIVPDANCRIYVMHNKFHSTRQKVANKLNWLQSHGCKVWVLVGPEHAAILNVAAKRTFPEDGGLHAKSMMVYARYAWTGAAYYKAVYTGSHNLSEVASYDNDEVLLKVYSNELYDAYVTQYFNHAWNRPEVTAY